MHQSLVAAFIVALSLVSLTGSTVAQVPAPSPSPMARPSWPSGDQLRRGLQEIGFVFRVARDSGDWLGWAPRASVVESSALSLGGDGATGATVAFTFRLLETDLLGADIDAALTALMEVVSRLPLDVDDAARLRRFVIDELLTEPPEVLEPCYVRASEKGATIVVVESESGVATVRIGPDLDALELDDIDASFEADFDPGTCAPIAASADERALGEPSSVRLTVGTTSGAEPAFEPPETALDGSLVTVVLTFRNDSTAVQSLTFEAPLEADTGPVAPGELKLIVVRQLEPGVYAFFSSSDPARMRGLLRISLPADE